MRAYDGVSQPSHQQVTALHASLKGDMPSDRLGRCLRREREINQTPNDSSTLMYFED